MDVVCYLMLLISVIIAILPFFIFKKRINMRGILYGIILYVFSEAWAIPTISSILQEYINIDSVSLTLINSAVEAILLIACSIIIYKFLIGNELNIENVISVICITSLLEILISVSYILFSYGLIYSAISDGTIVQNYLSQGYDEDKIVALVSYFESLDVWNILKIGISSFVIIFRNSFMHLTIFANKEKLKFKTLLLIFVTIIIYYLINASSTYFNDSLVCLEYLIYSIIMYLFVSKLIR